MQMFSFRAGYYLIFLQKRGEGVDLSWCDSLHHLPTVPDELHEHARHVEAKAFLFGDVIIRCVLVVVFYIFVHIGMTNTYYSDVCVVIYNIAYHR